MPHPVEGSSPLARGGRHGSRGGRRELGLIPARAGRTVGECEGVGGAGAHPRSRGADSTTIPTRTSSGGSSPLARGGHSDVDACVAGHGLIPARAGRTVFGAPVAVLARAHPRSRGADPENGGILTALRGSSPLARGGQLLTCDFTENGAPFESL